MKHHCKIQLRNLITWQIEMPDWLITTKTIPLAKNNETKNTRNYRPIALQNAIYKIYTGILTEFILDYCQRNSITLEQAAGKTGNRGCTGQLLINKMIYEEVTANRRNLITVWLDYKKAFDSVPHSWIIKSLQPAKVPELIINAIHMSMNKWKTKVYLYGEHSTIETDYIECMKGIRQGDLMSLILFVLAVNPLSYL